MATPTEVKATLAAAKQGWDRRLVVLFQPHRYSRTRDLITEFTHAFDQADLLFMTDIYAAGEAPIVAADGRSLARALRVAGRVEPQFVADIAALPQVAIDSASDGDVILCMGAGSIGAVPGRLVALLQGAGA